MSWRTTPLTISDECLRTRLIASLLLGGCCFVLAGCATVPRPSNDQHLLGHHPTGSVHQTAGFYQTSWSSLEPEDNFHQAMPQSMQLLPAQPNKTFAEPILQSSFQQNAPAPAVASATVVYTADVAIADLGTAENTDDASKYFFDMDETSANRPIGD
ncbi:MAG: hypothetical protein WBD31_29405 [Rubripirellula sp.]